MKNTRSTKATLLAVLLLLFAASSALFGQAVQQPSDPILTVDRIYASREFMPERFGGFDWLKDGESYAKLEPSATVKDAMDLVRYQIETGARSILLPPTSSSQKAKQSRLTLTDTIGQPTTSASSSTQIRKRSGDTIHVAITGFWTLPAAN